MIRLLAAALLCALFAMPAEAKQRRSVACVETGTIMAPQCGMMPAADVWATSDGRRVKSIRVTMKRERVSTLKPTPSGLLDLMATSADRVARPGRYIAGRLICAVNVGSALAERGIKGTGSVLALSYLRWGRASAPVPGAVAVSSRRGGGHVAIVSRVEAGQVYVWNPSPRGRGWQEVAYRHRAISYRVPG